MKYMTRCLSVVAAFAIAFLVSSPLDAKGKKLLPSMTFRWSDDPGPGTDAKRNMYTVLARREGNPIVVLIGWSVPGQVVLESAPRPQLMFAIPVLDWGAQTYPMATTASEITWMVTLVRASPTRRFWRSDAQAASVTLTSYDAKKNLLKGTFSLQGLTGVNTDISLNPVSITGGFEFSPPPSPNLEADLGVWISRTTSHDPTLVEIDHDAQGHFVVSKGRFRHGVGYLGQRFGHEAEPTFEFGFNLPEPKVSKLVLPADFVPDEVVLNFGFNADDFTIPYTETPWFIGAYDESRGGSLSVKLESYDKKKKLLTGSYSFLGLVSVKQRATFGTIDWSGRFVISAK